MPVSREEWECVLSLAGTDEPLGDAVV